MNKIHCLQKFASLGVVVFSAISSTSISTAPANAASFTEQSSLGWSNGTSDFIDDATNAILAGNAAGGEPNLGINFGVTFDPASAGGVALVSNSTGDFDPYFTNGDTYNAGSPTITFSYVGEIIDPEFTAAADFRTDSPLTFTFSPTDQSDDVTMTLPTDSLFRAEIELDGGVELELISGEWSAELENAMGGDPNITGTAFSSTFTFDEAGAEGGGQYSSGGSFRTSIPEPASILGLVVVSGLGLGLKRKKKLLKAG